MTVPLEKWGRDHWSMLGYLECRCVDNNGTIQKEHLRVSRRRHPGFAHRGSMGKDYPTRLKNEELNNHDDIDCIEDLAEHGLIIDGLTGLGNGRVEMTDKGREIAGLLRKHKQEGGSFATFSYEKVTP